MCLRIFTECYLDHSERLQSLNLDSLGITSKSRKNSAVKALDARISRKSLYNPYIPKDFIGETSQSPRISSKSSESESGANLYEDTIEEEASDRESPAIPRADDIIHKKESPKSLKFEGLMTKMNPKPEPTVATKPKRHRGVTVATNQNNNSKDSNGEVSPTRRKIEKIKNAHVMFNSAESIFISR